MDFILNATIGQLVGGGIGILAFLSAFIEIVPIKVYPISAILNWIGSRTNKGLAEQVTQLEEKVEKLSSKYEKIEAENEKREAVSCRVRILRFADEIRRDVEHSQESFEQTLSDIDYYEKYCKGHPLFQNNKTVIANERIKAAYLNCLEKNSFL